MAKSAERPTLGDGERIDYTSRSRIVSTREWRCQHLKDVASKETQVRLTEVEMRDEAES